MEHPESKAQIKHREELEKIFVKDNIVLFTISEAIVWYRQSGQVNHIPDIATQQAVSKMERLGLCQKSHINENGTHVYCYVPNLDENAQGD